MPKYIIELPTDPKSCNECPYGHECSYGNFGCGLSPYTIVDDVNVRQEWCPLKELTDDETSKMLMEWIIKSALKRRTSECGQEMG